MLILSALKVVQVGMFYSWAPTVLYASESELHTVQGRMRFPSSKDTFMDACR